MSYTARTWRYITLDVFTTTRYAGNPLAIVLVPPGETIGTEVMQRVAREFNYSETVFLHQPREAASANEWRMRIFTTDAELNFAGHPTIGTAMFVLSTLTAEPDTSREARATLRCHAGPIDVRLDDNMDVCAQIPHNYHLHDARSLSRKQVLDIQPSLHEDMIKSVDLVSPVLGMTFLLIELTDVEALARVAITGIAPKLVLDCAWDEGFVATAFYSNIGRREGRLVYRTRMIEKAFEDPATGSMSCGLAMMLAIKTKVQSAEFVFIQGVEMDRMSEIGVSVVLHGDLQSVQRLQLKGKCVRVMEGLLQL